MKMHVRQGGSVGSVILIWCLILSASAAALGSISMESSQVAELDWLSARANSAASSGLAWAKSQAKAGHCQASSTFSEASAMPGLSDMTVRTSCQAISTSEESGASVVEYALESMACSSQTCPEPAPRGSYAMRTMSAKVWR